MSEFSEACQNRFGDFNLPCEHGIGHGVLVYTDYDNLVETLELCETISSLPTGGCSSGVFMENNFHTMDETVAEGFTWTLTDDPYEPCPSLPERFQASCCHEQVQWWQGHFKNNFVVIGDLCSALKQTTQQNFEGCFHGIGNYLAASVSLDVNDAYKGFSKLNDNKGVRLCIEGASWLSEVTVQQRTERVRYALYSRTKMKPCCVAIVCQFVPSKELPHRMS